MNSLFSGKTVKGSKSIPHIGLLELLCY